MNVTKDVIRDLLPLYEDGEASQDSRRLVEEFLEKDPEFRAQAAAAIRRPASVTIRHEIDDALKTMERTRKAISRQKWLLAFAVWFTLVPFSFVFQGGRVTYFLVRDAPYSILPLWGAAAVLWYCYWRSRR